MYRDQIMKNILIYTSVRINLKTNTKIWNLKKAKVINITMTQSHATSEKQKQVLHFKL